MRKNPFMEIRVLGIRHHGVGSARNVLAMLEQFVPDLLFVEGPPEIQPLMLSAGVSELVPPIAAVCYRQDMPQQAAFYPFAVFSPEWQAACYANRHRIPLRMLDLPLALSWQLEPLLPKKEVVGDPMAVLAEIGGFSDADLWWEHHFEQKINASDPELHFQAVLETVQALRGENSPVAQKDPENDYREAWMARLIRQARQEMFSRIAIVCGAWHAPALLDLDATETAHDCLLKTLPKTKIKTGVTWVPWNNERLSTRSGYGAGLNAPGWYQHWWEHPQDNGALWLSKVAHLLRQKKVDVSTAHVIEAVRLAECLASLRHIPRPGLAEMQEATESVICMGDTALMGLVRQDLIVGHDIGQVPDDLPKLPLQADFEAQCRTLRLDPDTDTTKELDLRKPLDLRRSIFLHRLRLLELPWASLTASKSQGTFRETWAFEFNPLLTTALIDRGGWGNTVEAAARQHLMHHAQRALSLGPLADMIHEVVPAELLDTLEVLLHLLQQKAAVSTETLDMMAAVSPLATTLRYGNVRKTDQSALLLLVSGFVTRISVGLVSACSFLEEDVAQKTLASVRATHEAVLLLEEKDLQEQWTDALEQLSATAGIHPLIAGAATRLLSDRQYLPPAAAANRFYYALSAGQAPAWSAAWLEGFLRGSGMVLLYDNALWNLLYGWIENLEPTVFLNLLPILRRTFSKFEPAERRKLGEKARLGLAVPDALDSVQGDPFFNSALADMPMPLLKMILG